MKSLIDRFKSLNALVIGDLMIDEYLWGNVDRISPEAPVPVVSVEKETHTLGGAGNVINNLVSMGAGVIPVGTAGTGLTGKMIFEHLNGLNIKTNGIISEPDRPTTRKTRVIASNQQVLRIDKEKVTQISDSTCKRLIQIIEDKMSAADLIILSDYNKGLITHDLVCKTVQLAQQHKKLILADPKALDFTKYQNVTVLTPNRKEAGLAAQMSLQNDADLTIAGNKIMEIAGLTQLLITCGKDGMVLFEKDAPVRTIQSKARQVFDVSGAGDTVISILGLGLAAGADFFQAAQLANLAAGIVVGKVGTATATIDEIKEAAAVSEITG